MNIQKRQIHQEPVIDLKMKILSFDKDEIKNNVNQFYKIIQTFYQEDKNYNFSEEQVTFFKEQFSLISQNFPVIFYTILENHDMRMNILNKMIDSVFDIGNNKKNIENVKSELANMLHNEFTAQN